MLSLKGHIIETKKFKKDIKSNYFSCVDISPS